MGENPERIKDLQYSFSGFLWKQLDNIQTSWDEGDVVRATWRTLTLVKYLPVAIKEELKPIADQIAKELNQAPEVVEGHDFHTEMILKNKAAQAVAQKYLGAFINKMMTLLDQRGYLERGFFQQITQKDVKEFEEKEHES